MAEENLKRINAAYQTLQRSSARGTDESTTKPSNRPADGDRPRRSTFTIKREPTRRLIRYSRCATAEAPSARRTAQSGWQKVFACDHDGWFRRAPLDCME